MDWKDIVEGRWRCQPVVLYVEEVNFALIRWEHLCTNRFYLSCAKTSFVFCTCAGSWMLSYMMQQCWTTWLAEMKAASWWRLGVGKCLPPLAMVLPSKRTQAGSVRLILPFYNFLEMVSDRKKRSCSFPKKYQALHIWSRSSVSLDLVFQIWAENRRLLTRVCWRHCTRNVREVTHFYIVDAEWYQKH